MPALSSAALRKTEFQKILLISGRLWAMSFTASPS